MTVAESFEQVGDVLKENDFTQHAINIFSVRIENLQRKLTL